MSDLSNNLDWKIVMSLQELMNCRIENYDTEEEYENAREEILDRMVGYWIEAEKMV